MKEGSSSLHAGIFPPKDSICLCSPGCPGSGSVDHKAGLRGPPASASQRLMPPKHWRMLGNLFVSNYFPYGCYDDKGPVSEWDYYSYEGVSWLLPQPQRTHEQSTVTKAKGRHFPNIVCWKLTLDFLITRAVINIFLLIIN